MRQIVRAFLAGFGLLALASLAGSATRTVPPAHGQARVDTFVGRLSSLDAAIAVVSDGTGVVAYVCDGAGNTLSEDFAGTVDQAQNGMLTLQGEHGTILQLIVDTSTLPGLLVPDGHITGTVQTTDGQSYPFSTQAAVPPAGLYRAEEQTFRDGIVADGWWVRLNTGEILGVSQMMCPGEGFDCDPQQCLATGGQPFNVRSASIPAALADPTTYLRPSRR